MKAYDALEFCLKEVEAGRKTEADCAALFPDIPDLPGQLRVARRLRAWPAPEFSPQARRRIEAGLRRAWQARPPVAGPRFGLAAWALPILLVATLMSASAGIASAASSSWPGEPLYPLKRASETVQANLTPASGRASLYISFAARRLDEISVLVSHNRVQAELLSPSLLDLKLDTEAAVLAVPSSPLDQQAEILGRIIREASRQQTVLQAVLPRVPAQAQAALKQTLQASIAGQAVAEDDLRQIQAPGEGGQTATTTATVVSASLPPGQTDVPPGQTNVPPGQTDVLPGQTQVPPGQTIVPPGQTHIPPGQTQVPPGQTIVPPGQTHIPPGQTQVPPGKTHAAPQ
jgi:hypothetical protein